MRGWFSSVGASELTSSSADFRKTGTAMAKMPLQSSSALSSVRQNIAIDEHVPGTCSAAGDCIVWSPLPARLSWQTGCMCVKSLINKTHRTATAVLRRQCLGSAHQPPAGDQTPAHALKVSVLVSAVVHLGSDAGKVVCHSCAQFVGRAPRQISGGTFGVREVAAVATHDCFRHVNAALSWVSAVAR